MNFKGKLALMGISALMLTSCMSKKENSQDKETAANVKVVPGIDLTNMDQNVKPGVDFFKYANGGWLNKTEIPGDKPAYGSFSKIGDDLKEDVKAIIDEVTADKDAKDGSINQKIRDFYNSGMDTTAINNLGFEPIKPTLNAISEIKDVNGVLNEMAALQLESVANGFYVYVEMDAKKSDQHALYITTAGLSLPDRDYYLNDDARSTEMRAKYVEQIEKMLGLIGVDAAEAKANAETILAMETEMAKKEMTRVERRDPNKTYNKVTVEELYKTYPNFDWKAYFEKLNVAPTEVIVSNPEYFAAFNNWLVDTPVEDWKAYMRWHVLNDAASNLAKPISDQNFAFYGTYISGIEKQQPRWKKVLGATNGVLGEAIGQVYVKKHFPAAAKERMIELTDNLKKAFAQRIEGLDWMSDETKAKAQHKLATITVKVGYPDKWKDYSAYKVVPGKYFENLVSAAKFQYRENLEDLTKPIDLDKWEMLPQEVNAYYHPLRNEVVFPAGILQPPFFNMNADDAVNYGGIGVVIGHEMTHGFDDKGRLFDADGNLKTWWTDEDSEKFMKKADVLVKQFDNYVELDTLHVNGKLTLGENIADLGGLSISYTAFQLAQENKKMEAKDGFTPEQRFFLGYASVWRIKMKDEYLMNKIKTDVHSPGDARVNQTIFNVPEFYQAFEISKEDPLYIPEEDRAKIW